MTVDLIPQDELTLELLAQVLAKMYQHSVNGKDNASGNAEHLSQKPSGAGCDEGRRGQTVPEHDLLQPGAA